MVLCIFRESFPNTYLRTQTFGGRLNGSKSVGQSTSQSCFSVQELDRTWFEKGDTLLSRLGIGTRGCNVFNLLYGMGWAMCVCAYSLCPSFNGLSHETILVESFIKPVHLFLKVL